MVLAPCDFSLPLLKVLPISSRDRYQHHQPENLKPDKKRAIQKCREGVMLDDASSGIISLRMTEYCIIFYPYPSQFSQVNLRKNVQEAHVIHSRHGLYSDEVISPCCEHAVIKIWGILSGGAITHEFMRKLRVLLSRDGWIVNTKNVAILSRSWRQITENGYLFIYWTMLHT